MPLTLLKRVPDTALISGSALEINLPGEGRGVGWRVKDI